MRLSLIDYRTTASKIPPFTTMWVKLDKIMHNEITQTRDKDRMVPLT